MSLFREYRLEGVRVCMCVYMGGSSALRFLGRLVYLRPLC